MIETYRTKVNVLLTKRKIATETVKREKGTWVEATEQHEAALEAQKIAQAVAQEIQSRTHKQIARIVTRCLKAVFGENGYEFRIDFEQKRGKTEARLLFVRDGQEIDPTEASGGGVVDCASFALRLAALMLSRPQKRRLLVLDEPFRMLSRSFAGRMRELLLTLSEELGVQVIMVTHNEMLAIGKVIRIGE